MFKRPSVRYGRTPEPVTPYQRAQQAWDDRIGSARVQARSWRLMALGELALVGGLSAALVWQSASGSVVPWVVQVDRLGQAQAVEPATAGYRASDPQIAWHLARFIEQVRSVPADPIVLRQNWLRAYDDGRQVYIEFPAGIAQAEMPPLFVVGSGGAAELVNYRVRGRHMVVDRLFSAAELRLGAGRRQQRVRIQRGGSERRD